MKNPVENREKKLLEKSAAGNREAFGEIVGIYQERAFRAAMLILHHEEDARDLTQEAFVRAWRALPKFDIRRPFFPWYYRILKNACLNEREKNGRKRYVSMEEMVEENHHQFSDQSAHPSEKIHREQISQQLRQALGTLNGADQEIIVLHHFEEMSYRDIADALEIPIGTVMSRLFNARKRLAAAVHALNGGRR